MHLCLMPRDLSGTCEETAFLLKRFWPDCPPHSPFWSSFSRVVQVAFALDSLASKAGDQLFKTPDHQFRYLLSAYQTQWIREHYAKTGQTDEEALQATYRRQKELRLMPMRRLVFTIRSMWIKTASSPSHRVLRPS